MQLPLFQLDAFADGPFSGNPAAVCLLADWLSDELMQSIAMENNLSETAFLVRQQDHYQLRWFTPVTEVNLCGHATLASAFVVLNELEPETQSVRFETASGPLTVERHGELLRMDFPAWSVTPIDPRSESRKHLIKQVGGNIQEAFAAGEDAMLVYRTRAEVEALEPDFAALAKLPYRGVIATCPGVAPYAFVSRFFAPACGVNEDPVTGSAHCALTPYWSKRLGQKELLAYQVSPRGGIVHCWHRESRVLLAGAVKPYLRGSIEV